MHNEMLTTQKVIALIKKNDIPYSERNRIHHDRGASVNGFYAESNDMMVQFHGELSEQIDWAVRLASLLEQHGAVVYTRLPNKDHYVNPELCLVKDPRKDEARMGTPYPGEKAFRNAFANRLIEIEQAREAQRQEKEKRAAEQQAWQDKRMAEARAVNPHITLQREELVGDHAGLFQTTLRARNGKTLLCSGTWTREKKVVNWSTGEEREVYDVTVMAVFISRYDSKRVDDRRDRVHDAESVEDGLLYFISQFDA